MIIRSAILDDYNSIDALYSQLHKLHVEKKAEYYKQVESVFSKSDLNEYISKDNKMIYVSINDNNENVGFVECEIRETKDATVLTDRKILFVHALVTDIEHRKKGIARALFNHMLLEGRKIGIDAIELNVWKFNQEAIGFYESYEMKVKNIRYELEV